MNIEEMAALLVQPYLQPPRKLYRIDQAGDRAYYYFDGKNPVIFPSVTTVIRSNMPTSPHLIKWMGDMGTEAAEEYRDERAAFGTFMHMTFEQYLVGGVYDLDLMHDALLGYLEREGLSPGLADKWLMEQQKTLLGSAQWIIDHNVKPLCIEIALASDAMEVAGMIDLVCEMDIEEKGYFGEVYKSGANAGQPKESKRTKRIKAIVDFKSGKNFYDDHAIQLEIYRRMWNENFPEHHIEQIFNWAPTDWRTAPTYKFKEQTDHPQLYRVDHIMAMNMKANLKRERVATIISGKLRDNPSECIKFIDYSQLLQERHEVTN